MVQNSLGGGSIIVGAAVGLIGGFVGFQSWLDGRMDEKISDPEFLARLSERVRPDLIIDNNGAILMDRGAKEYIENITVSRAEEPGFPEAIGRIVITPKKYMALPPLISSASSVSYIVRPKRGIGLTWEYELSGGGVMDEGDGNAVRVEIISR